MKEVLIVFSLIASAFIAYCLVLVGILRFLRGRIESKERHVISLFYAKANKVPAIVEIMKKYTDHPDIFEDIVYLHKLSIIMNIASIYDILDLNSRMHREFRFLMRLSAKISDLHKDGNFLYIRNYVIFYENVVEKEIALVNTYFERYNRLIDIKNISLLGILFPFNKKTII